MTTDQREPQQQTIKVIERTGEALDHPMLLGWLMLHATAEVGPAGIVEWLEHGAVVFDDVNQAELDLFGEWAEMTLLVAELDGPEAAGFVEHEDCPWHWSAWCEAVDDREGTRKAAL